MTDTPQADTPKTETHRTETHRTETHRTETHRTETPSLAEGYEISTDPARIDVERVHRWLSTDAYWALGRSRDKQERAIAGSLNFGVYEAASGHQVAYARVVT